MNLNPALTKLMIGVLLFMTWVMFVVFKITGCEDIISAIKLSLAGLGAYHLNDRTNTTKPPTDKQAGFISLSWLFLLSVGSMLALTGCGAMNAYTGAALNSAESNYSGTKQNIKSADDMKLILWADTACALPIGALQRNASGNPFVINAVLTACPIPNVGIVQAKDGQVQVSFTQPTPTPPYVAPVVGAQK